MNRSVNPDEFRRFALAHLNREPDMDTQRLLELMCGWVSGRGLVPPPVSPALRYEDWLQQSPERRLQLLKQCSGLGDAEPWVKELNRIVDAVVREYAWRVEACGSVPVDPFEPVTRAVVVTTSLVGLREAQARMVETVEHFYRDQKWRRVVPGRDMFLQTNGEVLFGRPFGSSNKSGPCGTDTVWPRRMADAWSAVKAESDLERMMRGES